jgi:restriction endonuclease S subunit
MTALFPIPTSWAWTTLGEIAEVVGGVTKDTKKQSDPTLPEVPYLRVANVQRGYLDLREITKIRVPESTLEKLRLQRGDVLLNEGGDRDKLGRGWVWGGQIPNCIHQNHVFRARLPEETVRPRFLAWYINYPARQWFDQHAAQSVNLASISLSTIKQLPVPLPPLGEQNRIVGALDDHLSRLEHAESILSGIAVRLSSLYRAILKEKFRNISLGSTSHVRKLGDVAAIASGQTPREISENLSVEPGLDYIPFYKVGDMNHSDGRFMSSSRTYIHRDTAARLGLKIRPAGTIVIPKRGGAIATNKKRILRTPAAYDLNTMGIIPSREVDSTYLWRWLEQINLAELSDGSNVPQLNNPDLINLEILVPDLMVQQGLTEELDILTSGITRLLCTINELRKSPLRSMLLKEAFTGRLVPQDPADEPVATLLKRIHAEQVTQSRPRRRPRAANPTLQEETQL